MSKNKYKDAEAVGQIKTMHEAPEEKIEEIVENQVLSDPQEFQMAIGKAQMEGYEYVEVSQKLFDYLVKRNKTRYLTYGDPGIKVYVHGTRDEIEKEENMTAEEHYNYKSKKRSVI